MIFFDSETWPIAPGLQCPPMVCCQFMSRTPPTILVGDKIREMLVQVIERKITTAGFNTSFDLACAADGDPELLAMIFEAYGADRVQCLLVREKLIDIAKGNNTKAPYGLLDVLRRRRIKTTLTKEAKSADAWRARYHELADVPLDDWPQAAKDYALEDVRVLAPLHAAQEQDSWALADQYRQARADFVLQLTKCWGLMVDPLHVETFRRVVVEEALDLVDALQAAALVRADGSKDTKAAKARMVAICAEAGLPVKVTKTGKDKGLEGAEAIAAGYVALDADACASSGDPTLRKYARYTSLSSLRARGWRLLQAAQAGVPVQARFDVLKETGRTSCSKGDVKVGRPLMAFGDQIQNMNRDPGPRECYVPRAGSLILSVDFTAAELHTLAQVCIWMGIGSNLAPVLMSDRDVHLNFGAQINGWDYDWAAAHHKTRQVKDARQMAKVPHFGFPGGMGIAKFRQWAAATYDVVLTEQQAQDLKGYWFAAYPEMRAYFRIISDMCDRGDPLIHFKSKRYRKNIWFTNACNSYFQGLAADMGKAAGWELARACYLPGSILTGCRIINFVHDEWILEVPEDTAHECAMEVVRIMDAAGREWCPDVPCSSEPALSRRWRKGAEPVYVDGKLIPWEDRPGIEPLPRCDRRALDPVVESWHIGAEV